MKPPVKMLAVYVDETDLWDTGPLYEAIVRRLRQLGVAGATVQAGVMGFAATGRSTTNTCSAFPTISR